MRLSVDPGFARAEQCTGVRDLKRPSFRLPTFAENNRGYFQVIAAIPAAFGSALSVLLVLSDIWAIISLCLGRYRLRYLRSDMFVVVPAILYIIVMDASILSRAHGWADIGLAMMPMIYITIPLLIARCRVTPEVDYFTVFVRAAPLCGILLCPIMAYQVWEGVARVNSFAGNAFPFAMICAILGPTALLNLSARASRGMVIYALAGFLSCAAGLILSETRTVWFVFAVNLVVLAWFFGPRISIRKNWLVVPFVAVVLIGVVAGFHHRVEKRVGMLVGDFHALWDDKVPDPSMSIRLGLWRGGFEAARKHPFVGYGANNRRAIIRSIPIEFSNGPNQPPRTGSVNVSTFHNGFLTAMIDAGVFGVLVTLMLLVSPVLLAVFSPRDDLFRDRMAFTLFLFFTYAITGEVNIMFGQDLIDALFIMGCLVVALSVGTGPRIHQDPVAGKR